MKDRARNYTTLLADELREMDRWEVLWYIALGAFWLYVGYSI